MLALGSVARVARRNLITSAPALGAAAAAALMPNKAVAQDHGATANTDTIMEESERPGHWTHPELLPRAGASGINLNQSNPFNDDMPTYSLRAIGTLESVFREKNGTPRQGAVAPASRARLRLGLSNNCGDTLDGLQGYSYVWLIFMFSLNTQYKFNYKVKPPRLNGAKLGVLATRSPHRPNPIGLSLAKVEKVDCKNGILHLSGVDLVHGTPILDVKPYLPMHDSPPETSYVPEWVEQPTVPEGFEIMFSSQALRDIDDFVSSGKLQFYDKSAELRAVIEQVLLNEPRSVYRRGEHAQGATTDRSYGFCIDVLNVRCEYAADGNSVLVRDLEDWSDHYDDRRRKQGGQKK